VGEIFLGPKARFSIVPCAMGLVWLLVSRGSYQKSERIFMIGSLIFVVYIITAVKIGIPWGQVMAAAFVPKMTGRWDAAMIGMIVALIGTTISPYMQFYQQAAVRDKGITAQSYPLARWDAIFGGVQSGLIAACIIITCALTLFPNQDIQVKQIKDAGDVAEALRPLAGDWAKLLFAFGLLNASLMAAVVVPLSTSFAVTEALGWESGIGRRIRESPLFYGTYGALIFFGGLLIIVVPPQSNLIDMIINAQKLNCALLPVELILILVLINRRRLMGKHRNGFWMNAIGWTTAVVAGVLSLLNLVWPG
jgi:Mn2+/Fe2+ NRAMP family transporter